MADQTKTRFIQCHTCNRETEHTIVHSYEQRGSVPDERGFGEDAGWWTVYTEILQCGGCKEFSISRVENHSEADLPCETFYPPRFLPEVRRLPGWAFELPNGIHKLMQEVYDALSSGGNRLAGMGVRALLDDLMTQSLGDIGGFDQKVNEMVSRGLLSALQKKVLAPTLELGHAAIHRGYSPTEKQIEAALGIVEGLLNLFYVQEAIAEQLKEGVKPRERKVAASPGKKADKTQAKSPKGKKDLPQGGSSGG